MSFMRSIASTSAGLVVAYGLKCDYCEAIVDADDGLGWIQAAYSYIEGVDQDLHFCCRDHAERYQRRLALNEVERFRIIE